jgi:type I restriction enzyme R subunit
MVTEEQVHEKIERKLQSIGWEELPGEFFREHQSIENYITEELFLHFTLFINGIPIVIIEAKREFADYDTCLEAVKDIKEYEKRSPKLFNFVQFGITYGDEKRYMATLPDPEKREIKKKIEIWKNQEKIENILNIESTTLKSLKRNQERF